MAGLHGGKITTTTTGGNCYRRVARRGGRRLATGAWRGAVWLRGDVPLLHLYVLQTAEQEEPRMGVVHVVRCSGESV